MRACVIEKLKLSWIIKSARFPLINRSDARRYGRAMVAENIRRHETKNVPSIFNYEG